MKLSTPVEKLPYVGPVYARRLVRMDIFTLSDLLYHFPYRYDDFRLTSPVAQVQPGETVTVQGKIVSLKNNYLHSRKTLQHAVVEDQTGTIEVVWFNQPFLTRTLKVSDSVSLAGKVEASGKKLKMESPIYEKLTDQPPLHTGRLVPIYPETASVSSKWIRTRIANLLSQTDFEEFLPPEILVGHNLPDFKTALNNIHFPQTLQEAQNAKHRFAFEELFLMQLTVIMRKHEWANTTLCWPVKLPKEELTSFLGALPFELTSSQRISLNEILHDLRGSTPMNRLLEGDVGSGKTIVAATGAFVVAKNKLQTAVMAPTQILASQHYETLKKLLEPHDISVTLITGGQKNLKSNQKYDIVVGTHALIQKSVEFENLAFVVIDEQHKFGVEQRAELRTKTQNGCTPHILTMTATPIPRTIALTMYGDLNLSVINELPPGRQKITTWVVPPQKREGAYGWIREQIQADSQAFIVCPLIEESEHESMKQVKAAAAEYKHLSEKVFPDLKLGLLHGRMKPAEKELIIEQFRSGAIDILVSTPVVEVGIDIPKATIMLIEAAERFGLAQLHQLRGRVGRSDKKSYCLIFTENNIPPVLNRLRSMERNHSGAELAEIDLRLRGPGEVFGVHQHGFIRLKAASFSDFELIKKAREAAETVFPTFQNYPLLVQKLTAQTVMPD